jgi:hypothetical protein
MDAVKDGKNLAAAASALMAITNKPLDEKSIEALNQLLDVKVSTADIMTALEKASEKPTEATDSPSTDPAEETPTDTAGTSPDQPTETSSDAAGTSPEETAPAPSDTVTP